MGAALEGSDYVLLLLLLCNCFPKVPEGQTQVHLVTAHKLDADGWPKGVRTRTTASAPPLRQLCNAFLGCTVSALHGHLCDMMSVVTLRYLVAWPLADAPGALALVSAHQLTLRLPAPCSVCCCVLSGQLFSSATSVVLMTIRCIMTKGAATFKVAKDWTKVDPGLMPYVQDWLHSAALVQTGVGRVACEHEEQGGGVAPAANLPGPSRGTGGCCAETVRWSRQNGTPKVDCTHWRQQ